MLFSLYQSLAFLALLGSAKCACSYGTSHFPRLPSVPVNKFSYVGLSGPLNWYGLNQTANALCALGKNQSPIDIGNSSMTYVAKGNSIQLNIPEYPSGAKFENLGTNVEVVVNGSLVDASKTYALAQFHFHTPSEHRVDDEHYPMEMHLVFEAADKSLAVIGILIELGPTTFGLFDSVFAAISVIAQPGSDTITLPLHFGDLQAHVATNDIIRYTGSLTTPPCSESVTWIISSKPLYVDMDTYLKVKSVVKFNSRYTQNGLGMINLLENAAIELGGK